MTWTRSINNSSTKHLNGRQILNSIALRRGEIKEPYKQTPPNYWHLHKSFLLHTLGVKIALRRFRIFVFDKKEIRNKEVTFWKMICGRKCPIVMFKLVAKPIAVTKRVSCTCRSNWVTWKLATSQNTKKNAWGFCHWFHSCYYNVNATRGQTFCKRSHLMLDANGSTRTSAAGPQGACYDSSMFLLFLEAWSNRRNREKNRFSPIKLNNPS